MIGPFKLAAAAGLGAAAVASLAWAAPEPEFVKDQSRVSTVLARADLGPGDAGPAEVDPASPTRPGGGLDLMGRPPHGFDGPGRGPHGPGMRAPGFGGARTTPPPPLAARLAEEETAIGIRSGQLDVWRDYADALQAMLARPKRPDVKAGAFALQRAIAEDVAARGRAAERLKSAIDALKATLTADQLERAARMVPPPPFRGFKPPHGLAGEQSPDAGEPERGLAQPG